VTVILAGNDSFWRSLRAADDLTIEYLANCLGGAAPVLAQWALPFLFKLVVRISIRNVSGEFKDNT
jgi:hypothetical protein